MAFKLANISGQAALVKGNIITILRQFQIML